jgi:hypothetical protein
MRKGIVVICVRTDFFVRNGSGQHLALQCSVGLRDGARERETTAFVVMVGTK